MPINLRKSSDRGLSRLDWLQSKHTFSFADYDDPAWRRFSVLRVLNEDRVLPGAGFPKHGHRDMEILTYVISGELKHEDTLGNGSVIRPGDVQLMRAGTGVEHSEFNPSTEEPVHFLQIWILPSRPGQQPGYAQQTLPWQDGQWWVRAASPGGKGGGLALQQDARVDVLRMQPGQEARASITPGRAVWVQLVSGTLAVNGAAMEAGDGAGITGEQSVALKAGEAAELLLFDLPGT